MFSLVQAIKSQPRTTEIRTFGFRTFTVVEIGDSQPWLRHCAGQAITGSFQNYWEIKQAIYEINRTSDAQLTDK